MRAAALLALIVVACISLPSGVPLFVLLFVLGVAFGAAPARRGGPPRRA